MKKIIPLLVSALMLLSLSACGSKTTAPETTTALAASGGKTLIVYFSATGSTKAAAEAIAAATGGDLLELEPAEPYTSADLDYNNAGSRVSREHDDETLRDVALKATTADNWADYDTVYFGYPIWWGIAAWPVDTFVKAEPLGTAQRLDALLVAPCTGNTLAKLARGVTCLLYTSPSPRDS